MPGPGATFADLMPGFLVFGAGAGLMNVPLTNAILHAMPPDRLITVRTSTEPDRSK